MGTGVREVKATGGKGCGDFLAAKWAQLGQPFKAAAEKLSSNLKSEKRETRKDPELRQIFIRHQHFLLGQNT